MPSRTRARSAVTSVALLAAFVGACATPPVGSVVPPTITPPTDAPATSALASATSLTSDVAIHWDLDSELKKTGFIQEVVRGQDGSVAIGGCFPERAFECPQVWLSTDDRTWTRHPLPHRWPDVWPNAIAVSATGYVISGAERDLNGSRPLPEAQRWLRIWTSPNGEAWTRAGVLEIADEAQFLAAAPTGRIIVGTGALVGSSTGLYSSTDAVKWRTVKPADLGVETLRVEYLESTDTEVVLAGTRCLGCGHLLWTSTDGVHWVAKGQLPGPPYSIATDGHVRVFTWGPDIWSSTDDGPWVLRYSRSGLEDTKVVFGDARFLVVGGDLDGYALLSSTDGLTWANVPIDGLPAYYDDDCSPGWFTVAGGTVLLGEGICPYWRGTIRAP